AGGGDGPGRPAAPLRAARGDSRLTRRRPSASRGLPATRPLGARRKARPRQDGLARRSARGVGAGLRGDARRRRDSHRVDPLENRSRGGRVPPLQRQEGVRLTRKLTALVLVLGVAAVLAATALARQGST